MDAMEVEPTAVPAIPEPPKPSITGEEISRESLDTVREVMQAEKAARDAVHEVAKELLPLAQRATHTLHLGDFAAASELLGTGGDLLTKLVAAEPPNKWNIRGYGQAQSSVEEFTSARCLHGFFTTGSLLPRAAFPELDETEYLLGVMSFCQELARYAVGQATKGQAGSILLCKHLVETVQGKLMEFDFRNGPLRRKFDGIKYATKRLDDLLYELSLTGAYVAQPIVSNPKRRKTAPADDPAEAAAAASDPPGLVTVADFDDMRERITAYDAAREDVIKRCRDAQKLSKNAIYSMHRGNLDGARGQLEKAKAIATAIYDERVKGASTLRYGSFSNALEEYAEGALFLAWLETGAIVPMNAPGLELLEPAEYIGGLVDFTGEVGRVAVLAATRRDQPQVEKALAAALTVQDALMSLGMPSKLAKKEGALRSNIKKMEHVLYELSLVKASGRNVTASVEDAPTAQAAEDE
eukprot:m.449761 g.449761  ORF g.449761 m.449761 type:complete len:468 (+) comp19872_c0_seq1:1017-2420(+)